MGRYFDIIIDTILFLGDFICHTPNHCRSMFGYILYGFLYAFTMVPYKISLIYRFRKMWYPAKSDFDSGKLTDEMKEWLNNNLGKYRWKIILRLERRDIDYNILLHKYLCFRYKSDAIAFKLRWM